jgi:hypothetical protein
MKRITFILFATIVFIYACEEIRSYPPEPEIEYITHNFYNTFDSFGNSIKSFYLEIKYVDGDGDLSYTKQANDTSKNSKIFLTFYEKIDGIFQKVDTTNSSFKFPPAYDIPYGDAMQRTGQNKTITGKIKLSYNFLPDLFTSPRWPFDTAKVEVYIVDKSYHKSNIVTIPTELIFTD